MQESQPLPQDSFRERVIDPALDRISGWIDQFRHSRRTRAVVSTAAAVAIFSACSDGEVAPAPTTAVESVAPTPSASSTSEASPSPTPSETRAPITDGTKHQEKLSDPYDPEIKALAKFEKRVNRKIDGAMRFFGVPGHTLTQEDTSWHINGINAFDKNNLPGLYILEPLGNPNIAGYAEGEDREELEQYFSRIGAELAEKGIDPSTLNFVALPEPVVGSNPEDLEGSWAGATPESYAAGVKLFSELIRKHMPGAKVSALLDINKDPAAYFAQLPQLRDVVDTFVIQAYSNRVEYQLSTEGGEVVADVTNFIQPDKIKQISTDLGPEISIVISTGIAVLDRNVDDVRTVTYTDKQQIAVAKDISAKVTSLVGSGVPVEAIVLFTENKDEEEGIDFGATPEAHRLIIDEQNANGVKVLVQAV